MPSLLNDTSFYEENVLQSTPSVKTQYSKKRDTAYLDAVKHGDIKTAQKMVAEAAKDGDRLTEAQARAEIAADFSELIFTNENTLRRFVEINSRSAEGRNMLQRLFDAIRRFVARLKSGKMDYSVIEAGGYTVQQLEKAEQIYREVLKEGAQQKTGVTSDGQVQYSGKTGEYNGVNWAYEADAITKQDGAAFWSSIANLNKRGYYIPKSATGEYIIQVNNKLIFTNGDYNSPIISNVIVLNDKSETNMALAKEWIIDEESEYGRHDKAKRIIEIVYEKGYVTEYSFATGRADGRQNQRREGTDRSRDTGKNRTSYSLKKRDTDYLAAVKRGDIETAQKMVDEAAKDGDRLTEAQARAEIAADFSELIFTNENTLRRFVEINSRSAEGRNMLQRLFDAIRRFVARLKSGKMDYSVIEAGGYTVQQLEKAEQIYREVLKEGAQQKTGVTSDGQVQYTIERTRQMNWNDQINGVLYNGNNIRRNDTLVVGYPPKNIEAISRKPLAIPISIVAKATSGKDIFHSIKRGKIVKLDEGIRTAPIVIVNPSRNALVYVTNIKQSGLPIVVSFEMNTIFDGDKVHKATSIHLQEDVMSMLNGLTEKATVYVQNKNELNAVGATDSLRGLAATVKLIDSSLSQPAPSVKGQYSSAQGGTLDALIDQYGEIKPGEQAYREAHVPERTSKREWVSRTIRTVIEARATPDVILPDIDELIKNGDFSYEAYGDDAAIEKAKKEINDDGWDKSVSGWYKAVESGKISKDITTMGWVLYNNAVNDAKSELDAEKRKKKITSSMDILVKMVGHQRNAAQALQATRILKQLSPEAQLYGVVRSVSNLQRELEKKYKNKAPNLKVDEVFAERLLTAKDQKTRDEAMHDIYREIGRQMPSTRLDKWNAWRYLAMLGNPKTHIRNIGGNAFFAPLVRFKDLTATAIEKLVYEVSGGKLERTKALPTKELIKAAFDDYAILPDEYLADEKYNDRANANMYIQEGRQIFKTKGIEAARKFNSNLLSAEDTYFKRRHYAVAMAQYCKANGITAEMVYYWHDLFKHNIASFMIFCIQKLPGMTLIMPGSFCILIMDTFYLSNPSRLRSSEN